MPPIVGVAFGNLLGVLHLILSCASAYKGISGCSTLWPGYQSVDGSEPAPLVDAQEEGVLLARVATVTGLTAILFAAAGYWVAHGIAGYTITEFAEMMRSTTAINEVANREFDEL